VKTNFMPWKTIMLGGLMLMATNALAEKSSMTMGEKMFMDPHLSGSTNANSCNSCHAQGQGLAGAATNPDLGQAINNCLMANMGGHKMDGRSAEMRSMKMYVMAMVTHQ